MKISFMSSLVRRLEQARARLSLISLGAPTPTPAGAERDSDAGLRAMPAGGEWFPDLAVTQGQYVAPPAGAERGFDAETRDEPAADELLRAAVADQVNDECASRKGLKESAFGAQAGAVGNADVASDVGELERAAREGDEKRAPGAQDRATEALSASEHRRAEISFIDPAFGYDRGPLGSRDWALYARGWFDRAGINKEVSNELMRKRQCSFAYTEIRIAIGSEQVAVYGSEEGFKRPGAPAEMARLAAALVEQLTEVARGVPDAPAIAAVAQSACGNASYDDDLARA